MNGAQQRQHRRATDTLAQVITETQGAVVERFEEMEATLQQIRERQSEIRAELRRCVTLDRLETVMAEQDADIMNLRGVVNAHHLVVMRPTVWGRLRWLFKGI